MISLPFHKHFTICSNLPPKHAQSRRYHRILFTILRISTIPIIYINREYRAIEKEGCRRVNSYRWTRRVCQLTVVQGNAPWVTSKEDSE